ncbi:uncharacterized protein ARMOST_02728 [Armillaria ostoyae]|uniref:Uncharacterized protein n=1 Tax=Armillaria ostoyae TaxID=47428 RepID=A0A284QSJ4_ARMOS|nr:uncharacterized protein ARMOST_02728 [Armillaria ostoyae]
MPPASRAPILVPIYHLRGFSLSMESATELLHPLISTVSSQGVTRYAHLHRARSSQAVVTRYGQNTSSSRIFNNEALGKICVNNPDRPSKKADTADYK